MTNDEQARARLVEIALQSAYHQDKEPPHPKSCPRPVHGSAGCACFRVTARRLAGFKNPYAGHFCAAGITAAMEDAGLVVPASGTSERRGAVALLDFVWAGDSGLSHDRMARWSSGDLAPGDIIAWLQNKAPEQWLKRMSEQHAFATSTSPWSMCGKSGRGAVTGLSSLGRCSSCAWETRKGHVALIVAVDDESITTVGWNEGKAPGRVMKRRLWRDPERTAVKRVALNRYEKRKVPRSSTVLYRKPNGLLYGIARPVAR